MTALIMGIVNVTPDSFSDGGRYLAADDAIAHGARAATMMSSLVIEGDTDPPLRDRVLAAIGDVL